MGPISNNQPLAGRTILIAPSDSPVGDLSSELARHGARVLQCGHVEIVEPERQTALDDAIANLFGYDWLVFNNEHAAEFFLRRFLSLGKDLSELDNLQVLAIGEATADTLGHARVHFDLVSPQFRTNEVLAALETFVGGPGSLRGLNFLFPRASPSQETLSSALEEAGARVDVVAAYRTVVRGDLDLAHLSALLAGGGIDCVVFVNSSSVNGLAQLLDASDLGQILEGVNLAGADQNTSQTALGFGLRIDFTEPDPRVLAEAIAGKLGQSSVS